MTELPARLRRGLRAAALAAAGLGLHAAGQGAQVALSGVMGQRALLVIDGQPHMLTVGQAIHGVRLLELRGDVARVEVAGLASELRVGGAPVRVGTPGRPTAGGSVIVLPMGSGGHFYANGSINGRVVRFVVDTGATTVALGAQDAERIGLDYRRGEPATAATAGGTVPVWRVVLTSVRVGDVEVANVEATVVPTAMPFVLLGNSFLGRFQMRREGDQMRLERR